MNYELYPYKNSQVDKIDDYLFGLDDGEKKLAEKISDEIYNPSLTISDTIIAIPVAAHQEAGRIYNTLSQYAGQIDCSRFTIVLGLNSPVGMEDSETTKDTFAELARAKNDFPNLDIRNFYLSYHNPTIGRIRRDLWNGICLRALEDGLTDSSLPSICFNQDIDVDRINPRTISKIQAEYRRTFNQAEGAYYNPVKGVSITNSPDRRYPNISRVIGWHDYVYRKKSGTYEAGYVIPLYFYAERNGIDPKLNICEVQDKFFLDNEGLRPDLVEGAYMLTSMRRQLEMVPEHGLEVWKSSSLFSPNDTYRTRSNFQDISRGQSTGLISRTLKIDANELLIASISQFERRIKTAEDADHAIKNSYQLMRLEIERMRLTSANALKVFGATEGQIRIFNGIFDVQFMPRTAVKCVRYILLQGDDKYLFLGEQPFLGAITSKGRTKLNLTGYLGSILVGK